MSTSPEPRTPPRFVPTLTEVVELPDWAPSPAEPPLPPQPFMGSRPDAVLLTDVVPPPAAPPAPTGLTPEALDAWSDQITQHVLEQLDQRLAVVLQGLSAELAQYLAQSAAQQLRGELPDLVRQAVLASAPPGAVQAAADHGA